MGWLYRVFGCFGVTLVLAALTEVISVHGLVQPFTRWCDGTNDGFQFSRSIASHYRSMKRRYRRCSHVNGNLEITHLKSRSIRYNLSFLRNIRYVSGYVLIAHDWNVRKIPLHSLEIIRGNQTFTFGRYTGNALILLLNSPLMRRQGGLKQLQLPALKEITNGNVLSHMNPALGYIDTIDWPSITRHRPNSVVNLREPYNAAAARRADRSACPSGRMWGVGFCQAVVPDIQCHSSCDGRCFGTTSGECCHFTCAVGCTGPTDRDCMMCKDFKYNSACVGFCPGRNRPRGQNCRDN